MPQMQELVNRVHDALPGPWNKTVGRPKRCGLYDAVETTCMYIRHNATQEFLGDLRDTSQSTVSRMVSTLTPLVKAVLEEFVPDAAEAIEMVNGKVLRSAREADVEPEPATSAAVSAVPPEDEPRASDEPPA